MTQQSSSPRVYHIRNAPKGAFRVDRANSNRWGNPYVMGPDGTREEVIAQYRAWLVQQPDLMRDIHTLRGKDLCCWCWPSACHAEVLLELANKE